MAALMPYAFTQYFDDNGDPLSGGLVYSYAAGTSFGTPKDTFTSAAGTTANANPVVLDANGRKPVFLEEGAYDFVIKNAAGVTIDQKLGVGGATGSGSASLQIVSTMAQLRALAAGSSTYVDMGGYFASADGGGGRFYWNSASTDADNTGTIISPNSLPASGRWIRLDSASVDPMVFGGLVGAVAGLGATDATILVSTLQTLSANLTIPANISIVTPNGGGFTSSNGAVLTVAGPFEAPNTQVFFGDLVVAFGSREVVPQWFGAVGDGAANDLTAIQKAVDSLTNGTVYFKNGSYKVTAKISCKSNVWMVGESRAAILTGSRIGNIANDPLGNQNYPYLDIEAKTNVRIVNLKVDGTGAWTATPFAHPYGGGNAVGFTNEDVGVRVKGICSDIRIDGCEFTGLQYGVYGYGDATSERVDVVGNYFHNLGTGNYLQTMDHLIVLRNTVEGVYGNCTAAGVTDIEESMFADGFYLYICKNFVVADNDISDIIRIGIVIEGNGVTLGEKGVVANNVCDNMHDNRGTEINAGIWIEGSRAKQPIALIGNVVANSDARGIQATNCVITGGSIRNCALSGITGGNFTATGVHIEDCKYGANLQTSVNTEYTTMRNCTFVRNTHGGADVQQGVGIYEFTGNSFEDNGSTAIVGTDAQANFGIRVSRYYNDQKVIIKGNTFVSSANNSPGTAGQLYGILAVSGGDFSRTTNWVSENTFIFTGTINAYPTCLGQVPCAFAFDNTAGTITYRELAPYNGNISSKYPQVDLEQSHQAGRPRCLGFASAAPGAGTFLAGDYYWNNGQAANQGMIFLCTVGGTPGTWEERLWGNEIRTGGLKVTSGAIRAVGGVVAAEGTGLLQAFGVGTVPDQPAGNSESFDIGHNGAGGIILKVAATGTGSYRSIKVQNGGADAITIGTDQKVQFHKEPTFTLGIASVASLTTGFYEEGTFTGTLTGVDSVVTGTLRYVRTGKMVTLFIPNLTGTSNTTGCTITGMPANIRPARTFNTPASEVVDNSAYKATGGLQVDSGGVITLKKDNGAGLTTTFTNSGTKGLSTPMMISFNQA